MKFLIWLKKRQTSVRAFNLNSKDHVDSTTIEIIPNRLFTFYKEVYTKILNSVSHLKIVIAQLTVCYMTVTKSVNF